MRLSVNKGKMEIERKSLIRGKAIYPVTADLRVLLNGTHSVLHLVAKPGEPVEEFMRRAFSNALSTEHVALSTWQCIIYISPKWKKLSEDAINELETYIDRWCMDSEKRVSWGVYEDASLHSPEILIIANKAAVTEASDEAEGSVIRIGKKISKVCLMLSLGISSIIFSIYCIDVSITTAAIDIWSVGFIEYMKQQAFSRYDLYSILSWCTGWVMLSYASIIIKRMNITNIINYKY